MFTFGILARIEDYKGHLYLVYAAKLLKDRGYSNFRILVAGTGAFEEEVTRPSPRWGWRTWCRCWASARTPPPC